MKKVNSQDLNFSEPSEEELRKLERQEDLIIDEDMNEAGDDIDLKYFSGIGKYKLLSKEELNLLIISAREGNQIARDTVIVSNLRLVVRIAKGYRNISHNLTFLDLIQSGNLGLFRAIDLFDWRRGFKFSTYASWWIHQSITRELSDFSRTIRIPIHRLDLYSNFKKTRRDLSRLLGRRAKLREIAKVMGVPRDELKNLIEEMEGIKYLQDKLSDEDDSAEVGDMIQDERIPRMEEIMDLKMISSGLQAIVDSLSPKEKKILVFRYMDGLSDKDIAKKIGTSPDKVRSIREGINKKFKRSDQSARFKDFLKE